MYRLLLAGLILLFSFVGAEARTRHHQHAVSSCIETNSIMSPCQNWFSLFQQPKQESSVRVLSKKRHSTPRHSHVASSAPDTNKRPIASGNGVVKASSGAVAYVAERATGAFQCVINSLEKEGYPVRFMGGFARSGHIRNSLHYSGLALDINQLGRNVTKPAMPRNEVEIANGCGLISGAVWHHPDSGHFEIQGVSYRHHTKYRHRRRHRH
jgi:hypothetical protein